MIAGSRNERGQSLVEFGLFASLLLPLLVLVLLGVVDLARIALLYTTVSNAARVGTRYATIHGADASTPSGPANDDPAVINVVNSFAQVGGLNLSNLEVHVHYYSSGGVSPGCNTSGCWVQVTAFYSYDRLIRYFPLNMKLKASSEGVIIF